MKQRNIQIPIEIYRKIFEYFIAEERTEENEKEIKKWIEEKAEKMQEHEQYTKRKMKTI